MRFRYLKMVLLAGAFVANVPGDSAMLPVAHLSTSDRDDVPVPRTIRTRKMPGVDDEERAHDFPPFLKSIIETSENLSQLLKKTNIDFLMKMVYERMPAMAIFDEFKVQNVEGNLLADASWVNWAFCAFKLDPSRSFSTIIETMGIKFGYFAMTKKLLDAAAISDTKETANMLLHKLGSYGYYPLISSFKKFNELKLYSKIDNFFESQEFNRWSIYLKEHGGEHYAEDPLVFELSVFRQYYRMEDLLKMLTSPENANHEKCKTYLVKLKKDWLAEKELPSTIVSLLAHDQEQDHLFLDLETNGPSVNFWVGYWKQFNIENPDNVETIAQTFTDAVGFDRANTMINAALKMKDKATRDFAGVICFERALSGLYLQEDPFLAH